MPNDSNGPNLPPGWRCVHAPDGRPYYFNEVTRETSWTIPAGASTPPLAATASTSQNSLDGGSNVAPSSMYPPHSSYPTHSQPHSQPQPHPHQQHSYGQYPSVSSANQLAQSVGNLNLGQQNQGTQQTVSYPHGKYTLNSLIQKTSLQQSGTEFFEQERDKLLQINLGTDGGSFAWIKNGSMVSRLHNYSSSAKHCATSFLITFLPYSIFFFIFGLLIGFCLWFCFAAPIFFCVDCETWQCQVHNSGFKRSGFWEIHEEEIDGGRYETYQVRGPWQSVCCGQ